ncbi:MAG: TolC family protein [Paludibacter sp.]|nr:TolC family protein [Paludibacter sp.]
MRQINKKNVLVAAIIVLLPLGITKAQDTLTVSLSKALEIAMSESPTIKVADKEIQRVDYSKKEKLSGLLPTINASGQYSRNLAKSKSVVSFGGTPTVLEFGVDNNYTAGLSASLPIIAPTLWATLKLSEYDMQLAVESSRSSKLSLINQVNKAYYAILLTQDSYDVFLKSYNNSFENANVISSKFKQGVVSEYEWIRADVQVRNAQSNLTSAESAVRLSKLQLKILMGLDMYTEIKVEGKLSDFESKMYSEVLNIDTAALKKNTDLVQFDIKSKQLDQTLEIQKSAWLPTLAASANYSYSMIGNDINPYSEYTKYPSSSVGLTLSIPIFQGGSKYFKYKQIKIQMDELQYQRQNLKRNIDLQAISFLENIKKSLKKIESNNEGLKQAEKALSISQKMYDVGMATYLDLNNAELAYINAGLSYNQSIYDYLSAKADLEKMLGKESK